MYWLNIEIVGWCIEIKLADIFTKNNCRKMQSIVVIQSYLTYGGCTGQNFVGNESMGKIGTTGFFLGFVGGFHFALSLVSFITIINASEAQVLPQWITTMFQWSLYMSLLCLFHFMEFFTTAVRQPSCLSYSSYVVNHSKQYTIAALASWLEFWLENYFARQYKQNYFCIQIGLILVLGGQGIRTLAMWTCGEYFDHQIMEQRKEGHMLVTSGIYSILRHPSYFGWFYWSVGTQILLCNPICTVIYTLASWQFFNSRIPFEEESLVRFYRQSYIDYCKSTWIGIPFIHSNIVTNRR